MSTVLVSGAWAAVVAVIVYLKHLHEGRFLTQIERLCQRIQAPDVAVAQHVAESSPVEDDDDPDEDPAFTNIP